MGSGVSFYPPSPLPFPLPPIIAHVCVRGNSQRDIIPTGADRVIFYCNLKIEEDLRSDMQFMMMKYNISKVEALLSNLKDISSFRRSGQNKNYWVAPRSCLLTCRYSNLNVWLPSDAWYHRE